MQTGNTIFLGLGGSTGSTTSKPYGWAKSFVSIVCFCSGCFLFSHTSRFLGPLKRGTVATSFLLQAIIILVTAGIIQGGVVDGSLNNRTNDINWRQLLPIALLSFQAAGQIVGSRILNLSEIPTVVLTSILHDISTDPQLMVSLKKNVKRNRRIGAFIGILVGAVAGGFISEATGRMQIPLWIAGVLKLVIVAAWMTWPAKKESVVWCLDALQHRSNTIKPYFNFPTELYANLSVCSLQSTCTNTTVEDDYIRYGVPYWTALSTEPLWRFHIGLPWVVVGRLSLSRSNGRLYRRRLFRITNFK